MPASRFLAPLLLVASCASPALADVFVVDDDGDSGAGTLRQAISDANLVTPGVDGHRIQFAVSGTISLETALEVIGENTTIMGPGADLLRVERSATAVLDFPIFQLGSGVDLTVEGLTIADGTGASGNGGGIAAPSGGAGNLTVIGCHITGCVVTTNGGGIHFGETGTLTVTGSTISANTAGVDGGGISLVSGTGAITRSTISGNTAVGDGGGIGATTTLSVESATIASNTAANAGGLDAGGTTTLSASVLANNTATTLGPDAVAGASTTATDCLIEDRTDNGGITATNVLSGDPTLGGLADNGGSVPTHALGGGSSCLDAATNTTLTGFDQRGPDFFRSVGSAPDMGAYEVQSMTTISVLNTDDSGADSLRAAITAANAAAGADVISIDLTGTISLLTALPSITGEVRIVGQGANVMVVSAGGGAFPVLTLPNTFNGAVVLDSLTLADANNSASGGGLRAEAGGTHIVVIRDCGVVDNTSSGDGAGIYLADGSLSLRDSTVSGNTAGSNGGGVLCAGAATLRMDNCTVSGNDVTPGSGGGIYVESTGHRIRGCTIAFNTSNATGGGLYHSSTAEGAVLLTNCIVTNNTATTGEDDIDSAGTSTFRDSGFNNLVVDGNGHGLTDGINGCIIGPSADPGLLPLALNESGTTETHEVVLGTTPIDGALDLPDLAADQRGILRDVGAAADIGAFERQEVNRAPRNTLPPSQRTGVNQDLVLDGNERFRISDSDAGSAEVEVALAASNGTLTLAQTTGLTFSDGDGSDDVTMTFRGTIADINAALDGMTYSPATDVRGGAAIQITTNDLGNSGSGGQRLDSDTLAVEIGGGGGGGGGGSSCSLDAPEGPGSAPLALLALCLLLALARPRREA